MINWVNRSYNYLGLDTSVPRQEIIFQKTLWPPWWTCVWGSVSQNPFALFVLAALHYIPEQRQCQVTIFSTVLACGENFLGKCNKTSSKMHKHVVQ